MKLFVVRHTKVEVDTGICYGRSDVGVAATFETEKENVRKNLAGIEFDAVFCSPLFRCKTLAENIFNKEEITFDKRLMELNFGDWEMQSWDDIYNSSKGKIWMENYQTLPTLNGESYPEMVKRITSFYEELKNSKLENVAVFCHAGVVRIFKSIIENVPIHELFTNFKPEYGSVNIYEFN